MDKITVVCHKDHDKGYEDYVGKCLLCEVERLQKREWVGLTDEEMRTLKQKSVDDGMTRIVSDFEYIRSIEAKLKEKNQE